MADYGPRCTRRKQPNPRRKNEASGRVGRVKICFEEKYREIKIEKMPDEEIVSHLGSKDTLNSPNHSEPVGDEDDEERDNRLSDTLLSHSNPSSPENNTETTSTCLQNGTLSQNSTNKTDDKLLESSMAAVENGYQTKLGGRDKISDDKSEEEKIQEYLRRSDTAVIYPEPVESELDRPPSGSVIHDSTEKVEGEPDLRCPYCEKSFTRLLQLREHMTTTHREHEGNHSCPKCSASFLNRSHLDKHLALHSPNSQICKICNKTFANVYRLQRHMISHDESAVLRKFKCPECEKAFKFKHHLKEHIRIHSGEKPFACPNCGKRFSHSGSYSSHMTSKKCLVMNLKVRRAEKPRVRRNGEQGLRPIAPKFDGVGEMDLSVSSYPEQCLDFPRHFVPPFASTPINTLLTNHFQTAGIGSAFRPLPALLDSAGYRLKGVSIEKHEMQPRISFSLALDKDNNSSGSHKNELPTTAPVNIKKEEDDGLTKGNKDLNAVKKILAIVDATISKRQQEANMAKLKNGLIQDALHTHSRIKQDNSSADEASNSSSAKADSSRTERSACRFCRENFESRIDLHQHERYLCKLNKEIFQVAVYNGDAIKEEVAASLKLGQNGLQGSDLDSDDNDSNRDSVDDEVYTSDGKKMRVRSLINEEHLRILKAHYEMNPRPKKYELVRIGREIGFSKRVVQVWFQNMRARDRKKGRAIHVPYFPPGENITTLKPYGLPPPVNPSPFSPILSPFNGGVPTHHTLPISLYYASPPSARFAHTNVAISPPYVSSPYTPPPPLALPGPEEDQPLDLSLKNKGRGPVSIINVSSGYPQLYASSHLQDCDETDCTVLNLSQKSRASSPTESNNNNPKTQLMSQNNNTDNKLCKSEAKLEHSILYKYMQKEGLIVNERTRENLARKDMVEANIDSTMQDLNFCTTNNNEPCSSVELVPKSETFAFSPLPRTSTPDKVQLSSHVTIEEITSSSGENSHGPYDSDLTNTSQDPIEISQSGNKIKRARKKSWRQVESEEFQLDLDESSSVDGEKPTKRRKSWKQHKVDIDEGMYACDQCDKMFSKQSSLARHKYEHSGQRPHKCDVCGKAFKHKHHLTEHKRLHSGEKPFQCKKCLKRFSHSGSYSQHMNHRYSYCKPYRE